MCGDLQKPCVNRSAIVLMEPPAVNETVFDAYHKWLGIPPQHQPPDHYRLLGLEIFESDQDVIRAAAERQAAHIQNYKIGPQSEFSQRLLNEIARARVCLLDPVRKAEYDRSLRQVPARTHVADAPRPVAASQFPAALSNQVPLDVVPPSFPSNDVRTRAPTQVPAGVSVRPQITGHRQWRPSRGPAIAICVVGIVVVGIAIKLLVDAGTPISNSKSGLATASPVKPDAPRAKPQPNPATTSPVQPNPPRATTEPEPATATEPEPATASPVQRDVPLAKTEPEPDPHVKLPVPTLDQSEQARNLIHIAGNLTSQELLEEAKKQKQPSMRYVLYQMAIDAAVEEKNPKVAFQAVADLIEKYDVNPTELSEKVGNRFEVSMARPVPQPAIRPVPQPVPRPLPPPARQPGAIKGVELSEAQMRRFIKQCRTETTAYVRNEQLRLVEQRKSFAKTQGTSTRQKIARIEAELELFSQGRLIGPMLVRPLKVGEVGCLLMLDGREIFILRSIARPIPEITISINDGRNDNDSEYVNVVLKNHSLKAELPAFVQVVGLGRLGKGAEDDVPAEVVPFDVKPLEKLLSKKNWFVTPPAK